MNDVEIIIYMAFGVVTSVLLPILTRFVRNVMQTNIELHGAHGIWRRIWRQTSKYVYVGLFSLLTAVLLLAFVKATSSANQSMLIDTWGKAFISGYAWDSTLQRIAGSSTPVQLREA